MKPNKFDFVKSFCVYLLVMIVCYKSWKNVLFIVLFAQSNIVILCKVCLMGIVSVLPNIENMMWHLIIPS